MWSTIRAEPKPRIVQDRGSLVGPDTRRVCQEAQAPAPVFGLVCSVAVLVHKSHEKTMWPAMLSRADETGDCPVWAVWT